MYTFDKRNGTKKFQSFLKVGTRLRTGYWRTLKLEDFVIEVLLKRMGAILNTPFVLDGRDFENQMVTTDLQLRTQIA